MKHSIEYFLNEKSTLTPDDTSLGTIASSDWWQYVKPLFDDVIWMNFGQRTVFINNRFPYDDDDISYFNIMRTFVINLKSQARNFERLYNVYMMDYNPLWNVDGVTGVVTQDKHTGTDARALTGTDTSVLSGTDRSVASGTDSLTHSGSDGTSHSITKDDTTRTGNETIGKSGHDDDDNSVATFDSQGNFNPSTHDVASYASTDTHTYNNVKDSHELTESGSQTYGHVETTVHGKTDTMTYGKSDQLTHNTLDTETRNLTDEHLELQIRQGNIGVTMSQQLYSAEWSQWTDNMNNFVMMVVRSCINKVSYACEGV